MRGIAYPSHNLFVSVSVVLPIARSTNALSRVPGDESADRMKLAKSHRNRWAETRKLT